MAGRNYIPANALKLRDAQLAMGQPHHPAALIDHRPHPALIEERQHREIQSLLLDNQRLAATHVALKQELAAAQQELRHMSSTAGNVKAERDVQVREVYERSLKMEAEVRLIDGLGAELAQVRGDVQKLSSDNKELSAKLQGIEGDLVKARSELQLLMPIKAEIEAMHQEIQRGRAAIEYEKKVRAINLEQSQSMEQNMVSMAREIEKLQAELANAEKRARAAAAAAAAATPGPGYATGYGNQAMGYSGNSYSHQVQGGVDGGPQYGSGVASHGPYGMQRPHAHR